MAAESNERVLVTGATGAIGPGLVGLLRRQGYTVRTLSRRPPDRGLLPDEVENVIGDIADPLTVDAAVRDVTTVFHLAALLHVVDPPASMRAEYERINLAGTKTIVEAAISAGVKRLVFFSTIAVYGNSGGEILTEESPTRPSSCYAETKLAAERIVLEAQRADGRPFGTALRLGAVYGSRIKGNYHRLVRSLARGWFIPIGDGSNRRTLINDKDVANAALLVMREPVAAGQVYNVSDGEFHTLNKIIAAMCEALGRKAPALSFPERPVRVVANIVGTAARLGKRAAPINAATVAKFTEDIAVDSSRIQSEIGFRPEVDLKTGWRDAVDEMRKNGDL